MANHKMTEDERRAKNAAYMREWNASPAGRAYAEKSKARRAAYQKARREASLEDLREREKESRARTYATEEGRRRTLNRHEKWRKANPEAYAASRAKYYASAKGQLYKWSNSAAQRCRQVEIMRKDGRVKKKVGAYITAQDLRDLWVEQDGKCALTGKPMLMLNGKLHLDSPSVDRIETNGRYELGNVRLITWQANVAKGIGTDEDLYAFCAAVLAHRDKPKS